MEVGEKQNKNNNNKQTKKEKKLQQQKINKQNLIWKQFFYRK